MAEVTRSDGRRLALRAAIVAAAGIVALAIGVVLDPARAWLSYLMAFVFAFTIAVGGLIFLAIGYAANAKWMAVVRRTTEIVVLPMPMLALAFLPVVLAIPVLYPWYAPPPDLPHHELAIYEHRAAYLNVAGFAIRGAIVFAVLLVASLALRRWSVRRDGQPLPLDPVAALTRDRKFASVMLPLVGLVFTVAMIDWAMSLNGLWYSSMFPINTFAGGFLAAIALVTVITARVPDPAITRNHFHALGRMLFAFVVFWTYTAFFQVLLIWIADKPEEVVFYGLRLEGLWGVLAAILAIGHFGLPFLVLLPRALKFRRRVMAIAGAWLVTMHLVDIYWLVIPARAGGLAWTDAAALATVVGLSVATAAWRQRGIALVATGDPLLAEGARYRSPN